MSNFKKIDLFEPQQYRWIKVLKWCFNQSKLTQNFPRTLQATKAVVEGKKKTPKTSGKAAKKSAKATKAVPKTERGENPPKTSGKAAK